MLNIRQGENFLRNEGVVPSADLEKVLESQKAALDEIASRATMALKNAGGDYEMAITDATAQNDADLVEKLQVMRNVDSANE